MQSLAQTQMLLENVWAENYHDFGEFSRQSQLMDHSSFNVPLTRDLFGHVNGDLSNFPHLLGMIPFVLYITVQCIKVKSRQITYLDTWSITYVVNFFGRQSLAA